MEKWGEKNKREWKEMALVPRRTKGVGSQKASEEIVQRMNNYLYKIFLVCRGKGNYVFHKIWFDREMTWKEEFLNCRYYNILYANQNDVKKPN